MSRTSEPYYKRKQFDTAIARFDGFGGVIATSILKEEEGNKFNNALQKDVPKDEGTSFSVTVGDEPFVGLIMTGSLREEEAYNFKDPLTIYIPESQRTIFNMTIGGKSFQIVSDRDIYKERTSKTEPTSLFSEAIIRLKASAKFQFLEASRLFNKEKINSDITLNEFKMLRKKKNVPIESYLFQERYE